MHRLFIHSGDIIPRILISVPRHEPIFLKLWEAVEWWLKRLEGRGCIGGKWVFSVV